MFYVMILVLISNEVSESVFFFFANRWLSSSFFSFIEKANVIESRQQSLLRENVISTLRLTLSNLAGDFRTSQAKFLKQIEARKETVNSYLLASTDWVNTEVLEDVPIDASRDGKFVLQQLVIYIVMKYNFPLHQLRDIR